MGNFPTSEEHGKLYLVALVKEFFSTANLNFHIVFIDLGSQPNLPENTNLLALTRLSFLLSLVVLKTPVV